MTRLRYERRQRGQSQQAIAKLTRIVQPDISKIERGILNPTPTQLEALAGVFGIPPGELLKEVVVVGASA